MRQTSRGKFNRLQRATAEFTTSALDGYGLRSPLPARPAPYASYPVLVHRLASLLHAAFRPRLATTPWRFAITSPPSGCEGDLHPKAVKHARHTKKGRGSSPRLKSSKSRSAHSAAPQISPRNPVMPAQVVLIEDGPSKPEPQGHQRNHQGTQAGTQLGVCRVLVVECADADARVHHAGRRQGDQQEERVVEKSGENQGDDSADLSRLDRRSVMEMARHSCCPGTYQADDERDVDCGRHESQTEGGKMNARRRGGRFVVELLALQRMVLKVEIGPLRAAPGGGRCNFFSRNGGGRTDRDGTRVHLEDAQVAG